MPPLMTQEAVLMTRVITIGDSGVGKTALIRRMKTGQFLESTTPTVGAGVTVMEFNADQTKYSFQLWDTAGQELYRNIIPIYFRGAVFAIVMFSMTDEKSFRNLKIWLEELWHHASPDIGIVLVGSKCDEEQPAVDESEVRKFAEVHQLKLFFISSLTGQNISCLMEHIKVALITRRNPTYFQPQSVVLAAQSPNTKEGRCCRK
jgi:small GTP-binding protein